MNAMGARQNLMADFLADAGWGAAAQHPLPGDASTRRYIRLHLNGRTALLMDQPQEVESAVRTARRQSRRTQGAGLQRAGAARRRRLCALCRRRRYLRATVISAAPEIYAADLTHGFLLIEDLGQIFTRIFLRRAAHEPELYGAAIDALVTLHQLARARNTRPATSRCSPMTKPHMLAEVEF